MAEGGFATVAQAFFLPSGYSVTPEEDSDTAKYLLKQQLSSLPDRKLLNVAVKKMKLADHEQRNKVLGVRIIVS